MDTLDQLVVLAIGRHHRGEGSGDLVLGVPEGPEHTVHSGDRRHFLMVGAPSTGAHHPTGHSIRLTRSAARITVDACVRLDPHRPRRHLLCPT
jgi:hypothetical protein